MARRVRGVYGKPWSRMAGGVPLTKELLHRLGKVLVDSVVAEAKKDLAKKGIPSRGSPVGLPDEESFLESFGYRISGESTIEITSTWPWIEQHVEGRDPYRMTWLTRGKGVYKVPIVKRDGTVIIRTTPLSTNNAWIHPGFARHTFLERGVRKGREAMAQLVMEEVWEQLSVGDPFR